MNIWVGCCNTFGSGSDFVDSLIAISALLRSGAFEFKYLFTIAFDKPMSSAQLALPIFVCRKFFNLFETIIS